MIIRTRLHKHMRTSFRQILPQTALKILAGRKPACGFLPTLQQNYARKSAHISYEDRFLYLQLNTKHLNKSELYHVRREFAAKTAYPFVNSIRTDQAYCQDRSFLSPAADTRALSYNKAEIPISVHCPVPCPLS